MKNFRRSLRYLWPYRSGLALALACVLVIAILSAILTPADPMSMILLGVPLTALYFAGIAFCHFWPRKRSPFAEAIE